MTRFDYSDVTKRLGVAGVRGGLINVDNQLHPWHGLISVEKRSEEDAGDYVYIDGVRVSVTPRRHQPSFSISAFTYPKVIDECLGYSVTNGGLVTNTNVQKTCDIVWITDFIDAMGNTYPQVNFVYNAILSLPSVTNTTTSDNIQLETFRFDIQSLPTYLEGFGYQTDIKVDGRYALADAMKILDGWLYGTEQRNPRLPQIQELLRITTDQTTFNIVEQAIDDMYYLVVGGQVRGNTAEGVYKIQDYSRLVETTKHGIYEMKENVGIQ